jgi:hypothetical protein
MSSNICPVLTIRPCSSCQLNKSIFDFGTKRKKYSSGQIKLCLSIYCRECDKLKTRLRRLQHPEYIKNYNSRIEVKIKKKEWEQANTSYQKRKPYFQQYYQDHKEIFQQTWQTFKFKEAKRRSKYKRRHQDPLFRLRGNISNAINKALHKGQSDKAGQSIMQFLNYTLSDLKNHLQSQFDGQMNWENYGSYWHVDHIVPQSDLPFSSMLDDNFQQCWALSNLRPLEAQQNILDGATRVRHKKVSSTSE